MSKITITKDRMREILSSFMEERRVAAPVADGKAIDFQEVDDVSRILMGDEIPYKSPKEFFFPRCEKIITFKGDEAVAEMPEKGLVLFGARPCDLEALKIMTAVFTTGKFEDPFFKARLDASLVIGAACLEKKPGCFCELRETDMRYSESCDLFLENRGDEYEALYVSEKGREALGGLIPGLDGFEGPGGGRKASAAQAAEGESGEGAPAEGGTVEGAPAEGGTVEGGTAEGGPAEGGTAEGGTVGMPVYGETLLPESAAARTLSLENAGLEMFDRVDWAGIAETCQGCGLCTYICPTCHCFVFKDAMDGGEACRYRNWDSCMFPKFTLHASGHNPRASVRERYRQRVLHKYSYVKENFGYVACTGCGRCVRSCPAGMDIKAIVEGIMEELG